MTPYDAIDEDVLDAVAEVTNMIIGNVKTALENRLGAMGLSTPTVIYGRNFQTRSSGNQEWTVVPFDAGERADVRASVHRPERGSGQEDHPHRLSGSASAAHLVRKPRTRVQTGQATVQGCDGAGKRAREERPLDG